jgi:hypothetical protein
MARVTFFQDSNLVDLQEHVNLYLTGRKSMKIEVLSVDVKPFRMDSSTVVYLCTVVEGERIPTVEGWRKYDY